MAFIFISRKRNKKIILSALLGVLFFIAPLSTFAATLSVSPSSGSYSVGGTIKARVVVGSGGVSVNAVSGLLTYPADKLTLTSVSKVGSVITLWVQEPTFTNAQGNATFEGVILNGYTGTAGTVLTFTFKARAAGNATVALSSSSAVLLNDGNGTNATKGVGSATYTIAPVVQKPIPVIPAEPVPVPTEPAPTPEEEPQPIPEKPVPVLVPTPVITEYAPDMLKDNFVVAKGAAGPYASVFVMLARQGELTSLGEPVSILADEKGSFVYVSEQKMPAGVYVITPSSVRSDGSYDIGSPVTVTLHDDGWLKAQQWFHNLFTIKIPISFVLLLVGFILLIAYIYSRISRKQNPA